MGARQDSQQPKQPDFGPLPDLEDLLLLADIDESDAIEAMVWLEDVAPEMAARVSGE